MTLTELNYIVAVIGGGTGRGSVEATALRSEADEAEHAGPSLLATQRGRFGPAPLAGIDPRTRSLAAAAVVCRNGAPG